MVQRLSTGIKKLDEILGGGFPSNSIIAIVGPPGSGKSILCMQFINQGVRANEDCLFLTTDRNPEEIKNISRDFNFNLDDVTFLDSYSWRAGKETQAKLSVKDPSDLNYLNILIGEILREMKSENKRIVIDSVSALILYNGPEFAMRFLHIIGAKARIHNSCMLITLESGVHDEKTINMINYIADGAIELRLGERREMRILKMLRTKHELNWLKYGFGKGGIEIYDS